MLNFVNPLFAWLGLAAVIPLVIHILNRRRFQKVRWAAMEFLLKAVHKNRRRLQMENLILLLLRMLIIIILAFILAKPYLKTSGMLTEPDTHYIIAVDNSYSMDYRSGFSNLFDEAKRITLDLIESLRPERGDKLSLITISDKPEILISESSFQMEQAKKKLANLSVSDYTTDISKTFILANEILSKSVSSRKILYLITDNQKIAWDGIRDNNAREALQELIKTCKIKVIQVGTSNIDNNLISRIYTDAAVITTKKPVTFYAEIHNYSSKDSSTDVVPTTKNLKVNFLIGGHLYTSSTITLPQNKSVSVPFIYTFSESGQYWVKIELESDNLIIDDSCLYAVSVREGINTLIINGEPSKEESDDEIIFLRYALAPLTAEDTSRDTISPYLIDVLTPSQWLNADEINLDKNTLIILANVAMVYPDRLKNIDNFVKNGGGLLVFLGDQVDKTNYNDMFYKNGDGLLPYPLGEIKGDKTHNEIIRFGEIDFSHPAFSFFSSLKERFNTLSIYQYYELLQAVSKPADTTTVVKEKVLARLAAAGNPMLIAEKSYGKGRTIIIATSADTEWNLMPVKPMYVMLLDQIALYLSTFSEKTTTRNILVREPIELRIKKQNQVYNYTLKLPKKGTVSLSPTSIEHRPKDKLSSDNNNDLIADSQFHLLYDNTDDAGLYTLSSDSKKSSGMDNTYYFAVNPDPREGDLRRTNPEELKQLIPSLQFDSIDENKTMPTAASDDIDSSVGQIRTSPFWKYLLYILFASIILEMLLAWRFGRR